MVRFENNISLPGALQLVVWFLVLTLIGLHAQAPQAPPQSVSAAPTAGLA